MQRKTSLEVEKRHPRMDRQNDSQVNSHGEKLKWMAKFCGFYILSCGCSLYIFFEGSGLAEGALWAFKFHKGFSFSRLVF